MIRPTPRLEIHTDRIAENLHAIVGPVSYTHLTLPTICSV